MHKNCELLTKPIFVIFQTRTSASRIRARTEASAQRALRAPTHAHARPAGAASTANQVMSSSEGNRKPGFRFSGIRRKEWTAVSSRSGKLLSVANCVVRACSALTLSVLLGMCLGYSGWFPCVFILVSKQCLVISPGVEKCPQVASSLGPIHTWRRSSLHSNLRANSFMLLATCVNTPIDCSVFHNLYAHVARCSASCVNGALIQKTNTKENSFELSEFWTKWPD